MKPLCTIVMIAFSLTVTRTDAQKVVLIWDHEDVSHTSFVIRATNNPASSWSNWPVRVIVHNTNAWKIDPKNPCEFFACQASNEFGLSEPAAIQTNAPVQPQERLFTRSEVAAILLKYKSVPIGTPPIPCK